MAGERPRRQLLWLVLCAGLSACVGSPSPPASLGPIVVGPTPVVTRYEIGTTIWMAGFVVTVEWAEASLDSKGGPLLVAMSIRNDGDIGVLDVPMTVIAGDAVFEPGPGQSMPVQPARAVTMVRLEFEVIGRSSIDDGVLRIGRPGDHVAAIPLRPNPAAAVTLQPRPADLTANGRAGTIRIQLRRLTLRWDLPDWHDELAADKAALTIWYDATYTGDFSGGTPFTAANVGLRLPDGTTVKPLADGHSQSVALLRSNRTVRNLSSRFEIPDGLSGSFAFVIREGSQTKAVGFTIEP